MPSGPNPLIISAERIALSSLICSVPAPPTRNDTACLSSLNRKYALPLHKERQLARTLAFLSHSKDDVDHIPALCLEEDQDTGGLNVIFAVNRFSHQDGGPAISRIKTGFDRLFSTLASMSAIPRGQGYRYNSSADDPRPRPATRIKEAGSCRCNRHVLWSYSVAITTSSVKQEAGQEAIPRFSAGSRVGREEDRPTEAQRKQHVGGSESIHSQSPRGREAH